MDLGIFILHRAFAIYRPVVDYHSTALFFFATLFFVVTVSSIALLTVSISKDLR